MLKNYTRASVVIFGKSSKTNDRYVLLFRNRKWRSYCNCGGKIENGETLSKTALRELEEESLNLFKFNKMLGDNIYNIDNYVPETMSWTKIYILCIDIDEINMMSYFKNKKQIDQYDNKDWHQTDDIELFDIKSIYVDPKIFSGSLDEISYVLDTGILEDIKPVKMKKVYNKITDNYFLFNTESYCIY